MSTVLSMALGLITTGLSGPAELDLCAACPGGGWNSASIENMVVRDALSEEGTIQLRDAAAGLTPMTDLLISFDTEPADLGPMVYSAHVESASYVKTSESRRFGSASGQFSRRADGIEMTPYPGTLFTRTSDIGSFTASVWIRPTAFSESQTLLERRGVAVDLNPDKPFSPQIPSENGLGFYLENGRLTARFVNFLTSGGSAAKQDLTLQAARPVPTRVWTHVALRFDGGNREVTIWQNGDVVAQTFATVDGAIDSAPLFGRFDEGNMAPIRIGQGFAGQLDDLQVYSAALDADYPTRYRASSGRYVSAVLDMGTSDSAVTSLRINQTVPHDATVRWQYRITGTYAYDAQAPATLWKWTDVAPDEALKDVKGRFIQLRAEVSLYGNSDETPQIKRVRVEYLPGEVPRAPHNLAAMIQNGRVILNWHGTLQRDVTHYNLYYGLEPGRYTVPGQVIGIPIESAGERVRPEYVLGSALMPANVYFLALTAVDASGQESGFSNEVVVDLVRDGYLDTTSPFSEIVRSDLNGEMSELP